MIKMQLVEDPRVSLQVLSETLSPGALGAVMYTPQALSDAQKAQARENIGVKAVLTGTTKEIAPAQVAEAIEKGQPVAITYIDQRGTPDEMSIVFSSFVVHGGFLVATVHAIGEVLEQGLFPNIVLVGSAESGEWSVNGIYVPTQDYVDGRLGDISAALDGILAIQNELMGGDGV